VNEEIGKEVSKQVKWFTKEKNKKLSHLTLGMLTGRPRIMMVYKVPIKSYQFMLCRKNIRNLA
jgi:hypothetical protein